MDRIAALDWIIDFLEDKNIPYVVSGGLAAIAYGSKRPLNDIDLYVLDNYYFDVIDFGKEYISKGPERFEEKLWKIDYVQFIYKGKKVEVGSSKDINIYDVRNKCWRKDVIDFSNHKKISVFGKLVRVMDKSHLVEYKSMLNREVDISDIREISNA